MSEFRIINAEKLQDEVRKVFLPYLSNMLKLHEGNVISVFVYGSAASGGYIKGRSNINSAFVLNALGFQELKNSIKAVSRGIRSSVAAPLFLTEEYILSSLDVFPIEFMDMKENHVLLYGRDVLSGLEIKGEHARLFCEQQIKGKLVRIRQAYLEVGLAKKGMKLLLKESLNSLIPVFRNLIRIKGAPAPIDKPGIIEKFSEVFGLDPAVFLRVYMTSAVDSGMSSGMTEELMKVFMDEVEKLSLIVDGL